MVFKILIKFFVFVIFLSACAYENPKTIKVVVINNTGDNIWIESNGILYTQRSDTSYSEFIVDTVIYIVGTTIEKTPLKLNNTGDSLTWIIINYKKGQEQKEFGNINKGVFGKQIEQKLLKKADIIIRREK